jgi:hypothetical protein
MPLSKALESQGVAERLLIKVHSSVKVVNNIKQRKRGSVSGAEA